MPRLPVLGAGDLIAQKQLPAHLDPATMSAASTADRARANHTGTQSASTILDFTEAMQDAMSSFLVAGANVTLTYNDAGNSLTIASTGGGGTGTGVTDPEVVRDTIAAALVGAGPITITYNDTADTITITSAATVNSTDAQLRDRTTHTGIMPISGAPAGCRFAAPLNGTINTNASMARPSARTDIFFDWNSTVQPVNMLQGDTWNVPA